VFARDPGNVRLGENRAGQAGKETGGQAGKICGAGQLAAPTRFRGELGTESGGCEAQRRRARGLGSRGWPRRLSRG